MFVSEDVTLEQVVRLAVLAQSLDPLRYEVHFACGHFDELVFRGLQFARHGIATLDREIAFRALAAGKRLYETSVLRRYAEEELELFRQVNPDVVVGDFRLSLAASAPVAKVPLVTLINAYWSPYAVRARFPIPDHPLVSILGVAKAEKYFPVAMPKVFGHFAEPVNALRKHFGLQPVGSLMEVLTFGDITLYPDPSGLVPVRDLPQDHQFIGPILWSPQIALPSFFETLDQKQPVAYITLGSSGNVDRLPMILRGLRQAGIVSIVSTAGRTSGIEELTAYTADYLPGSMVARRCAFVVSNGGSSTGYQALAEGIPVLGVPFNLDQYLAMTAIETAGAGLLLRSGTLTEEGVTRAADELCTNPSYRFAAQQLARSIESLSPCEHFRRIIDRFQSG
ncbi:MAG TPA: nucleotide disphospho-sugar-binding domain-containing protein [Polyangiaceae bacterium]